MPTQNTTNFYFAAWCVCVCAMHQSENHWSSFFSTQIDCAHNGTSSDAFHNFYSVFMSWVKTAQVSECRSGIDTKPWANSTHCRVDWLINQTPINGSFKKCLPFHAIEKKVIYVNRSHLIFFLHRTDLADCRWIRFQRKRKEQQHSRFLCRKCIPILFVIHFVDLSYRDVE